jgi:hypothetical protein
MADLTKQRVNAMRDINVACALALDNGIAELQSRSSLRLAFGESLGAQLIDTLGDVERKLAIDVAIDAAAVKRVQQASEPAHH